MMVQRLTMLLFATVLGAVIGGVLLRPLIGAACGAGLCVLFLAAQWWDDTH